MSIIQDRNLAKSGHEKINWVKSYMPVLSAIEKEFKETKPFAGKKIAMSIHLEAKTAYLATVLKAGGADVYSTGCNPLSTQDDVAAALCDYGVNVFAIHGADEKTYTEHLKAALSCHPDVMIDDGGDFIELLHGECRDLGDRLVGGCEETTTGIHRLRIREKKGTLDYTMIDINDADCKHLFDNRYGTGQSTLDAIMHTTNLVIAGKKAVVAGYGWCGKGIARRLAGMGAVVFVTEVNPVRALEAVMDGFTVLPMDEAAAVGDLFITVTGCKDVIVGKHFEKMKDGVLLANAGHFNVEINKGELAALSVSCEQRKPGIEGFTMSDGRVLNLLADGRLVNLAAGNGHPAEIMDMSFALQAKCLEYLVKTPGLAHKLYAVPVATDMTVATMKLSKTSVAIDELTESQKEYLGL
ncbi:MAG: adenosylhomocysteinase [Clostridia bacterium]|nr:adenosylhomocysteinase [Clostridia bacterium]